MSSSCVPRRALRAIFYFFQFFFLKAVLILCLGALRAILYPFYIKISHWHPHLRSG